MAKYIHIVLRSTLFLGGMMTLLALLVALGNAGGPEADPSWVARWGSIFDPRCADGTGGKEQIYLVDRESGKLRPVSLPGGERWEYVGISPWSAGGDELEAVGRYYRIDARGGGCGLGRIRLPEGEVLERFDLDVLPTSRPCWVPGRPGRIVFTAGDGQLYRYDLAVGKRASDAEQPTPMALEWRCPRPAKIPCFLTDPAICADPRYRGLAVVTLISQGQKTQEEIAQSMGVWWLRLSGDASAIEACGPIVEDEREGRRQQRLLRRFPTLAAGRDGNLELIYLAKDERSAGMAMVMMRQDLDVQADGLQIRPGTRPTVIGDGCAAVPPVVDSDGRTAYGFSLYVEMPIRRPI